MENYNENEKKPIINITYIFPLISLFAFPPIFMILGIVFGSINISRGYSGGGFLQIILSLICGSIGMFVGASVFF